MNPTRSALPLDARRMVETLLNQTLADLLDLHSQVRNAHWNVRGPQFHQLHKLFEELAGLLDAEFDDLAERITALGGRARGSVRESARGSRLPELPLPTDGPSLLLELADRFALIGNDVRGGIQTTANLGDPGTSDLLTGLSRTLDKSLWLLEAHTPGA